MEILLLLASVVILIVAILRLDKVAREIDRLRRRVEELERRAIRAEPEGIPPAATAVAGPPVVPAAVASVAPDAAPPAAAPLLAPPLAAPPLAAPLAPAASRPDVEQIVGAVWLQHAGSVLLLVGFFFSILWGYTTGRLGPGALVIAGEIAGFGLVWRGDRLRRTLPGLGHALIGVGCGAVWLALYLGHFTLRVLPAWPAFALLIGASLFTAALGLRYKVQGIAALGVLGAFLPQALGALVPLRGFSLAPGPLLAYVAVVDALVFALAARAGWSALALAALGLTSATWIAAVPAARWSWPVEIGLAGLFAALGLAPLPRLARLEGTVRPIDLAVIAIAPLALLAASWPMFTIARAPHVAMLLLSLAALYLLAAWWVDQRRPERDVWRPLTGAAAILIGAALERASGRTWTPLAWTIEGAALAILGLAPRAAWLRVCGHAVAGLGAVLLFGRIAESLAAGHPHFPFANATSLRDALAIAALVAGALRLERARPGLGTGERVMPNLWLGAAAFLLAIGLARESVHFAWALENGNGTWRVPPDVRAASSAIREETLAVAVIGLAWMAEAAALVATGLGRRWTFPRGAGLVLVLLAGLVLATAYAMRDGWGRDQLPALHRAGIIQLAAAAIASALALLLARRRGELHPFDRRAPEVCAAVAALLMLAWLAREADHVARVVVDVPGPHAAGSGAITSVLRDRALALARTLASVAWLAQAILTFAIGWGRSAFLRWMGLALVGITVVKFLVLDLAHADPFWRFLTALVAGAAMLAVSYVYQRRARRAGRAA